MNLIQRCTLRRDVWTKGQFSWGRVLFDVVGMVKESWLSLREDLGGDDGFAKITTKWRPARGYGAFGVIKVFKFKSDLNYAMLGRSLKGESVVFSISS